VIEVALSGDDRPDGWEDELRSLLRWLREDEGLARQAEGRIHAGTAPESGHMGTAFDILQLTLGSGLSAGSLAVSFLQWRDARRGNRLIITLRRGDTTVEIPAEGDVDAALLARVIGLVEDRETQSDGPAS
jgi:hypothetical protein